MYPSGVDEEFPLPWMMPRKLSNRSRIPLLDLFNRCFPAGSGLLMRAIPDLAASEFQMLLLRQYRFFLIPSFVLHLHFSYFHINIQIFY